MSRHNAVLFVPEDLTKIAFWDLYATGMPIFVPDSKILSKLLCFEENSLEKMHYFDNNARHPFVKTGQFEDLEPFNLKTHCARKLQLWAPLADYYQFPHVYLGFEARRLEISLDWKKRVTQKPSDAKKFWYFWMTPLNNTLLVKGFRQKSGPSPPQKNIPILKAHLCPPSKKKHIFSKRQTNQRKLFPKPQKQTQGSCSPLLWSCWNGCKALISRV